MSDSTMNLPTSISPALFPLKSTVIFGLFIIVAAVAHAMITSRVSTTVGPLHVGVVVGDVLVREQGSVAHHKCNGCRIECYDSFVVVYIDRIKVPSWTGDYVLMYPWSKIEHLTLADPTG